MGSTADKWTVGLDDLRGLFQPWGFCNSVILFGDQLNDSSQPKTGELFSVSSLNKCEWR